MKAKLSAFKYDLPEKFIAQYPAKERDGSRLMVIHRESGKIEHKIFKDVIHYFVDGDTFIFNNTKVFPARMFGIKEKTEANIEVFLLFFFMTTVSKLYNLFKLLSIKTRILYMFGIQQ